ncbi:MAG: CRTAC1 family protein [Pseudomonadota bacterium]
MSDVSGSGAGFSRFARLGWLCALAGWATLAAAAPLFEDATGALGVEHTGATYGAAWGDLNGDGWPDLWVGNHNEAPSLYLNVGGRKLRDVAASVWTADAKADAHGAAWADFDNDGDQDLVEVVAATIEEGQMCVGCGANHLFVNQSGRLVESGAAFGLARPGLARSPLWFDADNDGQLDLFVTNLRKDDQPASQLYINRPQGFKAANRGIHDRRNDRRLKHYRQWFGNALRGSTRSPQQIMTKTHHGFARLADLNGDGDQEVVHFSQPLRVFQLGAAEPEKVRRFEEITGELNLPPLEDVGDTAIADFDGDGRMDLYLTAGAYRMSQVELIAPNRLYATLLGYKKRTDPKAGKGFSFKTEGSVRIRLSPEWVPLSAFKLGAEGSPPSTRVLRFDPERAKALGRLETRRLADGGYGISFDEDSGRWHFSNKLRGEFVDVVVTSTAPITDIERDGFPPFRERGRDALFLAGDEGFSRRRIPPPAGGHSACHSVTAGDFDNDMDVDLYLVCSESVRNRDNRLLLNDGQGGFTLADQAGGAPGSSAGRGDVVASADFDRDGFLDLFVANGSDPASPFVEMGPHQFYRNRGNDNHYLQLDLRGKQSNRDGIGARVEVVASGVTQTRLQDGGVHRFTQDHQRLHFGLGSAERADLVRIHWPSGVVQELTDVAADQILVVEEARS